MSGIEILAVIGLIGYIIFRQVQGEPLRGKRAVLLPAVLTVVGFLNLRGGGHLGADDIGCLVIGTAGSAVIGLAFGAVTRLRSRNGYLWAQLPARGLWLWAALIGWRLLVMLLATGLHAHVAASAATLLLSLGVNRLAQAAVIVPRAMSLGIPFAPEKDGKVFMAGTFSRGGLGDRLSSRFSDRFDSRDERGMGSGDYDRGHGARGYGDRGNGNGNGNGYDARDRYADADRPRDSRPQSWGRP